MRAERDAAGGAQPVTASPQARARTRPRAERPGATWQRRAWYAAGVGVAAIVVLALMAHSTGDLGGRGVQGGRGGRSAAGAAEAPPATGAGGSGQAGVGGSGNANPPGGPGPGAGQGQGQGTGSSMLVSQPKPTPTTTGGRGGGGNPPTSTSPAAGRATFTALTGPGCPQDSSKGVALDQWGTGEPSWTGDGCQGFFRWSRVAGPRYVHTFTWWFNTPLSGGQDCGLFLYIPNPSDHSLAAAPAARYTVAGSAGTIATFTLNQGAHNGTWVDEGTFHFPTAHVQLTLSNQGTIDGTAVAAAPLRINCHG